MVELEKRPQSTINRIVVFLIIKYASSIRPDNQAMHASRRSSANLNHSLLAATA